MDPIEKLHQEWLGLAQPEGLVVTASVLRQADVHITWPVTDVQARLADVVGDGRNILDLRRFLREVLEWDDDFIVERELLPDGLRFPLEGGTLLEPRLALKSADDDSFVILVGQEGPDTAFDKASDSVDLPGTAAQRFERLLRESGVFVGLLTNGRHFRLIFAPKGESGGWLDFRVSDLLSVDGRPLLGAFHMLLRQARLLSGEPSQRLTGLLKASREYQNTVSEKLREQVLAALRELLTGFQDADRLAKGTLLREYQGERQKLYTGLVTALMRMVFVLYAEERKLLPMDADLYANNYSLTLLYAQLVQDRDRHGADALDARYGAWARIITLFRVLHDGTSWYERGRRERIPARRGAFFDPDEFPFLEGRGRAGGPQLDTTIDPPRLSDGVLFRVLNHLLLLDGERLQYKGLDVEQIGSVYEGLMGFDVELAVGESIPLTSKHVVVDLEQLLAAAPGDRVKTLKELGVDAKGKIEEAVKKAKTVDELKAALDKRKPKDANLIPKGALFLQPGEERRRTGSHYTPRKLTAPIVETTLRPVLEQLGREPTPEQILALKVCDPAMGSGAFLVEACRQLADHLVAAWRRTNTVPKVPDDEDLTLHARRLVAQRCLYGVDKNPLAVDLARLSMWLVTFAKLHPFTFVDHALRHGDSLVGLSREQIASFSLDTYKGTQVSLARPFIERRVREVEELRQRIHAIGDPPDITELTGLWKEAQDKLHAVRLIGDLVVASFFGWDSDKARLTYLEVLAGQVQVWLQTGEGEARLRTAAAGLREGARGVPVFHWEIEFPEVFDGKGGFDCFVGNPPFLGGTLVGSRLGLGYHDYLMDTYPDATGLADVVSFFLRRVFDLLQPKGTFGLIGTNTVAQGDTRTTGLEFIVRKGRGQIYEAQRRYQWPGEAAVVVSLVHATKASDPRRAIVLDGRAVDRISSFLLKGNADVPPNPLEENRGLGYLGTKIWGAGFVFEDNPSDGSSSLADLAALIAKDKRTRDVIFQYIGGEEFNTSPTQSPSRFVIDFGEMSQDEARRWPALFEIVEARVRPVRAGNKQRNYRDNWWLHANRVREAGPYLRQHGRLLALSAVSKHLALSFAPRDTVVANSMVVILLHGYSDFGLLQSRVHETWAVFLGSSLEDRLRYTTPCFDTFPRPKLSKRLSLENIGKTYYDYRAQLMIQNNEGLTKTYNRFHDRDERSPEIAKLRDLHAQMDRAVLDAYGWTDIQPTYDFRVQLDESERFTWSEDTRDEVLARLLELNQQRAAEEKAATPKSPKPGKKGGGKKKGSDGQMELG